MNGITKLKPGRYEARATRRINGRKVNRRRICHSLEEARNVKRKLQEELERLAHGENPPQRMTLGDFAVRWLEAKSARVKPSTAEKYLVDLERHILPVLGHRFIDTLRPSDIETFMAEDGGSANTRRNRLNLLRQLAKDSLAEGLAERDWTARVRPPQAEGYSEDAPNLLTAKQLTSVLAELSSYWQCLAYFLALTGLRWGEVTGLHWDDIDFDNASATIRRTNWKGTLVEPKTKAAKRRVPLAKPLIEKLQRHRQAQVEQGHPGLTAGWVFPTAKGDVYTGYPLRAVLDRACSKVGVPRITTHGLRRTWNNLARRVATGQVVRAIIGHTDEAMTEHYSVVDLDEKHAAASAVVEMLEDTTSETSTSGVRDGVQAEDEEPPEGEE